MQCNEWVSSPLTWPPFFSPCWAMQSLHGSVASHRALPCSAASHSNGRIQIIGLSDSTTRCSTLDEAGSLTVRSSHPASLVTEVRGPWELGVWPATHREVRSDSAGMESGRTPDSFDEENITLLQHRPQGLGSCTISRLEVVSPETITAGATQIQLQIVNSHQRVNGAPPTRSRWNAERRSGFN